MLSVRKKVTRVLKLISLAMLLTIFYSHYSGTRISGKKKKERNYRKRNDIDYITICTIFESVCNSQSSKAFELATTKQLSILCTHLQQNKPQLEGRIAMVILGFERFKQGTAFSFRGCDFALALRRRQMRLVWHPSKDFSTLPPYCSLPGWRWK